MKWGFAIAGIALITGAYWYAKHGGGYKYPFNLILSDFKRSEHKRFEGFLKAENPFSHIEEGRNLLLHYLYCLAECNRELKSTSTLEAILDDCKQNHLDN